MSCSRCGAAIVSPEQFDRGLCASCSTTSSLSALVALAAEASIDPVPPTRDREWKATVFSNFPEVM